MMAETRTKINGRGKIDQENNTSRRRVSRIIRTVGSSSSCSNTIDFCNVKSNRGKNSNTRIKIKGFEGDDEERDNFASCYMQLCKQYRLRPLSVICITLPHSLDLMTDRVKLDDWGPILNSLSYDRSLKSISVKSRAAVWRRGGRPLEEIESEDSKSTARIAKINKGHKNNHHHQQQQQQQPVVLTRYLLEWMSHSVSDCVKNSQVLTWLRLEGVPFPVDCLQLLCMGLSSTSSLRHLSLRRCWIGDEGCELLCRTVADVRSLRSLDLSECRLSEKSSSSLAAALSRQKLSLYDETWKESLRYREPDLEAMPGLRRLTLNGNPRFGDQAVSRLIEAIRDSLWLKALDLQNCGLTDIVGREIVNLLEQNTTLIVVDVRVNLNISQTMLRMIFQALQNNNDKSCGNSVNSKYTWMSLTRTNSSNVNMDIVKTQEKSTLKCQTAPITTIDGTRRKEQQRRQLLENTKHKQQQQQQQQQSLKKKIPLCVDLRTSIEAAVGTMSVNSDNDEQNRENPTEYETINRELTEARIQRNKLTKETEETDLLLAEERKLRESAESKLRKMNENLYDLKMELKKKERESRGFLLVSEQSLEDIATSFKRLIEMLETDNEKRNKRQNDTIDIRPPICSRTRKTKSVSVIEAAAAAAVINNGNKKFVKSEGDVTTGRLLPSISIIRPIRMERNIGDCPDVHICRLDEEENVFEQEDKEKQEDYDETRSNCEKARTIFEKIINNQEYAIGRYSS